MQKLIGQIAKGKARHEPSYLDHNTFDTYFRLNNAIIVWNRQQAEDWAEGRK